MLCGKIFEEIMFRLTTWTTLQIICHIDQRFQENSKNRRCLLISGGRWVKVNIHVLTLCFGYSKISILGLFDQALKESTEFCRIYSWLIHWCERKYQPNIRSWPSHFKGVLTSSKGGSNMLVLLASPRWRWCPSEYLLVSNSTRFCMKPENIHTDTAPSRRS